MYGIRSTAVKTCPRTRYTNRVTTVQGRLPRAASRQSGSHTVVPKGTSWSTESPGSSGASATQGPAGSGSQGSKLLHSTPSPSSRRTSVPLIEFGHEE